MAAYKLDTHYLGAPPIDVTGDTTQRMPLGTIVRAVDPTYGEAEFEYTKFTGTVAKGDMVLIDRYGKTGVVCPAAATKGVFGCSMAAQVTGQFGYVMKRGVMDEASVLTGAAAGVAPIYESAVTAGKVTDAVTANAIYEGVAIRLTGTNSVGTIELNYPTCTGR